MRTSSVLPLALPLIVSVQGQIPFLDQAKDLVAKAQGLLTGNFPPGSASRLPSPSAALVSKAGVTDLTLDNWHSVLTTSTGANALTSDGFDPWMVLTTGGNKSCGGHCGRVNDAWDQATTTLLADPTAPHLARLDCEAQEVLCGAWATGVGQVWFYQISHPAPGQSKAPSPLSIHQLNFTTVTPEDITSIYTEKKYVTTDKYEGAFHPLDGWLAEFGLLTPIAYFLWGMAKVPSWMIMIGLSLFSRYFVSKRMPNGAPPFARPADARPAPPPAGAAAIKKRK